MGGGGVLLNWQNPLIVTKVPKQIILETKTLSSSSPA